MEKEERDEIERKRLLADAVFVSGERKRYFEYVNFVKDMTDRVSAMTAEEVLNEYWTTPAQMTKARITLGMSEEDALKREGEEVNYTQEEWEKWIRELERLDWACEYFSNGP